MSRPSPSERVRRGLGRLVRSAAMLGGLVLALGLVSSRAAAVPKPGPPRIPAQAWLEGAGLNVDSLAFWEAPEVEDTLLFVTAKDNQLVEVWRLPFVGNELTPLTHPSFSVGSRVNGVAIDPGAPELFVSVSAPESTVAVFSLPGLGFLGEIVAGSIPLGPEPNLAWLRVAPGDDRLYVTDEFWVHAHDAATGAPLGSFLPGVGIETLVGDALHQLLYVPDENGGSGVRVFDPDGTPFLLGGSNVFGAGHFDADAEGIALYTCPPDGRADSGSGWIAVADQTNPRSDFEFFDRESWAHLGTLQIEEVNNTDGIATTQRALPGWPSGIFAAVDDDQRVALVGWDAVTSALGLACAPDCSDGVDGDGDGLLDHPEDPGCADAADLDERGPGRTCDDGIDQDGDGAADYPDDPGCRDANHHREDPACQDGIDNDGDGRIDWDGAAVGEPDPQCREPWIASESVVRRRCGLGFEITPALVLLLRRRRRGRERSAQHQALADVNCPVIPG